MKTAIHLPDDLLAVTDSLAAEQGVTRSRLFEIALTEYVANCQSRKISERLDAVYATESSALDPFLRRAASRTLGRAEW